MRVLPQSDSLLLKIDGREAIPVRAIPLVTPWGFLPPDELARNLKHLNTLPHDRFKELYAYHLVSGTPHRIEPWEWDNVLVDLSALESRYLGSTQRETPGAEDEAYQSWVPLALAELPAGAFVWRADFEREFAVGWTRRNRGTTDTPEPTPRLNYSPLNMSEYRDVVLEGFPPDGIEKASDHRRRPSQQLTGHNVRSAPVSNSLPVAALGEALPARRHQLVTRRDDLTPAIEAARAKAADPKDYAAVWVLLVALADSPTRPAPLLGVADGEVKYQTAKGVKCITRDALIKRLKYAEARRE